MNNERLDLFQSLKKYNEKEELRKKKFNTGILSVLWG
jgi:hypothetical protein